MSKDTDDQVSMCSDPLLSLVMEVLKVIQSHHTQKIHPLRWERGTCLLGISRQTVAVLGA